MRLQFSSAPPATNPSAETSSNSDSDTDSNSQSTGSYTSDAELGQQQQQQQQQQEQQQQRVREKKPHKLRPIYEDYMPLSPEADHPSPYSDGDHIRAGEDREHQSGSDSDSSADRSDRAGHRQQKADGKKAKKKRADKHDDNAVREQLVLDVLQALNAGKSAQKKSLDKKKVDGKGVKKQTTKNNVIAFKPNPKKSAKTSKSSSPLAPPVPARLRKTIGSLAKQLSSINQKFVDLTGELNQNFN